MGEMTATTDSRAAFLLAIATGLLVGCAASPTAPPTAAPTATTQVQQAPAPSTPTAIPPTAAPVVGFTPETTQKNSAGVPLPAAPGAVNIVVTYTPIPSGTPPPKSGLISVSVGDNYFDPVEVRITVGSTLEWAYNGGGGETESVHNVIALDNSFSSGDLNPNSRFAFTFNQPGEFAYVCSYHAKQMTGKVFVL